LIAATKGCTMKIHHAVLLLAATMYLGACSSSDDEGSVLTHFGLDNGVLVVHARDATDATIDATGRLTIAGKSISTTPEQKILLQRYYVVALAVREQAFTTAKAGIATGAQAITSVAKGLANGDPDTIDKEIDAKAAKVDAAATQLCKALAEARIAQESLAAALPQFRPYATISAHEIAHCDGAK